MQSLQIFENDNYNIKTHVSHEIAYLNAKDVAKALNYTNPQKAIRDHVYEEDKKKLSEIRVNVSFNQKEQPHSLYITESGVYALIFGSKKEEAKNFKRWLCTDVLPKLRKRYEKQLCAPLNLQNESDLHQKVIQAIRRFWSNAVIVPGLIQCLSDSPEKRMKGYRHGYIAGQPDILLLNHHIKYNGLAIELKNPKGSGKLSDKQLHSLEMYRMAGFQVLVSDEYDVILFELIKYFENIRLICEFCSRKFKTNKSLHAHCNKFHKCC